MRSSGWLFVSVAGALLGAGGRLVYLEQTEGAQRRQRAEEQEVRVIEVPAQRGEILDTRGRVLAGSVRRVDVYADVTQISDPRFVSYSLGPVLGIEAVALEKLLRDQPTSRYLKLCEGLTEAQVAALEEVRDSRRISGIIIEYRPQRAYPAGPLAAHVVGMVIDDPNVVGTGIELAYDDVLRGQPGKRVSIVDRLRRRIGAVPDRYQPPRDGASVILTLDAHLQQRTEQRLAEAVTRLAAEWGLAVIMDAHAGEVLALAICPGFDPQNPTQAPPGASPGAWQTRLTNRALTFAYEPGSIMKPFIAAPALEAGKTRLDEVFTINGPTRAFGRRIIRDVKAYDALTAAEVVSKSSNIGMALLGERAGNENLHAWVRRFGFGDVTGLGLPGEAGGIVYPLHRWGSMSTQSIPMGYELGVTSIQLVTAMSAIANEGVLLRPRIVRGVVGAEGQIVEDLSRPVAVRRVLEQRVARAFREQALLACVESGTGTRAQLDQWTVFGKTGTARMADTERGGYLERHYLGSFLGGAPASEPRLTVLVSIYTIGKEQYYGGTVAAPLAAAILQEALSYLRIPPDRDPNVKRQASGSGGD